MSLRYAQVRIIAQVRQPVGRGKYAFVVVPTRKLGDLMAAETWRRAGRGNLRLNVISDAKAKSGVATSRQEFQAILDEIVGRRPARIPFAAGARSNHDQPHGRVFSAV